MSLRTSLVLLAASLWLTSAGCIPDVNQTGVRGQGGGGGDGGSDPVTVVYRNIGPEQAIHPGNAEACLSVTCPEGTNVVAGGGAWDEDGIELNRSRPTDEDTWSICGTATTPAEWYAEAICASVETTIVSTAPSLHPGDGFRCIGANCPEGMMVVGGGGDWETPGIRWDGSRPLDADTWALCGYSDQADTHEWSVDAVCAPLEAAIVTVDETVHAGGDPCIEATCPTGTVALGGGGVWNTTSNAGTVIPSAHRPVTDPDPIGWRVCAEAATAAETVHDWTVDVVCLSP